MKHYPKTYEDLFRRKPSLNIDAIDSALDSVGEMTEMFQHTLRDNYRTLFRIAVQYLWLEKQIMQNGKRRTRRFRNGHVQDQLFNRYMNGVVGINQTPMVRSRWFTVVSTAVSEMFPSFLHKNPFNEPEYYEWPFKHVSLDFLVYIYQVENRIELLEYADKKEMTFLDFKNWVNNYVLSYNDDKGKEIYSLSVDRDGSMYIKHHAWEIYDDSRDLEQTLHYEHAKEIKTSGNDDQ